jgi:opacity protein-like surface antigen
MRKVLGIVLLVLAFSLVSGPAFAQQVELDLKSWYPGVVGADEWVADYGTYVVPSDPEEEPWPWPHKNENELVRRPGSGLSFILSGDYFIMPSISVGASYWSLSRADAVGVELENEDIVLFGSAMTVLNGYPELYWIKLPWWEDEFPVEWQKVVLAGKETLSMSALDAYATKTFSGPGWEAGLSGGVRRAAFNEHLSTELDFIDEHESEYSDLKWHYDLSSKVSVSAVGPQVGIEGTYALADKLVLKAGAKVGLLFGTVQTDAAFTFESWYAEIPHEWEFGHGDEAPPHGATDATRITTFDLSAALAYQITDQWSVEAGYYASIWQGVPSPYYYYEYVEVTTATDTEPGWKQPEARTITARGLTLGVNFKF